MDQRDKLIVALFDKLMNGAAVPAMPVELEGDASLQKLYDQLIFLRRIVFNFAKGDLSEEITIRGYIAGSLKSLQAHLRHMTWQVKQVESGDFEQRMDFLGEFSSAFNNMVLKLDDTLKALREKEEMLTELTNELQHEVDMRGTAMVALQESEARFRYLASHDVLTGAFNRRYFMDHAEHSLQAAVRNNEACSLGMFDLDHFKNLNDTYGHQVGDDALRHVVTLSNSILRKTDILARYGGEEFILFFSKATFSDVCIACERIRDIIASTPLILANGKEVIITASFGACSVRPQESDLTEDMLSRLVNKCDEAMYFSKTSGRNKVTAWDYTATDSHYETPGAGVQHKEF